MMGHHVQTPRAPQQIGGIGQPASARGDSKCSLFGCSARSSRRHGKAITLINKGLDIQVYVPGQQFFSVSNTARDFCSSSISPDSSACGMSI